MNFLVQMRLMERRVIRINKGFNSGQSIIMPFNFKTNWLRFAILNENMDSLIPMVKSRFHLIMKMLKAFMKDFVPSKIILNGDL